MILFTPPAHLNPNALVPCVPDTLTFSEFSNGTFVLSSQEKCLKKAVTFFFLLLPWPTCVSSLHCNVTLRTH